MIGSAGFVDDDEEIVSGDGAPGPWNKLGLCRNPRYTSDDFFLEGRFGKGSKEYEKARDRAKAVCRQCPVEQQCRKYALVLDIRVGIWGATTASDRRKILYPGSSE